MALSRRQFLMAGAAASLVGSMPKFALAATSANDTRMVSWVLEAILVISASTGVMRASGALLRIILLWMSTMMSPDFASLSPTRR